MTDRSPAPDGNWPLYFTQAEQVDRLLVITWTVFTERCAAAVQSAGARHSRLLKWEVTRQDQPHDLSGIPGDARRLQAHAVAHQWDVSVSRRQERDGTVTITVTALGDRHHVRQTWSGGQRADRAEGHGRTPPPLESDLALITGESRTVPPVSRPEPPAAGTLLGADSAGTPLLAGANVAVFAGPHDGLEGTAAARAGDGTITVEPHDRTGPQAFAAAHLITGDQDRYQLHTHACWLRNSRAIDRNFARQQAREAHQAAVAAVRETRPGGETVPPGLGPLRGSHHLTETGAMALTVLDQDGREYQVEYDKHAGTVTVTRDGRALTGRASGEPRATRTARELAGRLARDAGAGGQHRDGVTR